MRTMGANRALAVGGVRRQTDSLDIRLDLSYIEFGPAQSYMHFDVKAQIQAF